MEAEKSPEEGYHLTEDLIDKAISFIADSKQIAPNKPFFMYLCPGAVHAPHHVPKEWADQYKGQFDDGWDAYREKVFKRQKELGIIPKDTELSRHDPDVPDWNTLSAGEKKLYARMMEVFAGMVTHTDYHYGRLFDFLRKLGEFDNTVIMFISDNGASSEGGPTGSVNENKFFNNVKDSLEENLKKIDELGGVNTFNHYAWGWTHAGNTPFRRWKRETYRGGISDPFVVHWPKGIKAKGEVRTQYAHAIDMVPTVLEALGIEAPTSIRGVAQSPIEGLSFAHAFDNADAPSKHRTQYFEMMGHRSIYHDGWRAVCPWPGTSFTEAGAFFGAPMNKDRLIELDAKGWELYDLTKDFAENHNLADQNRPKLIEMIANWYVEAGKYNVLPVDSRGVARIAEPRPQIAVDRKSYTYYPGTQMVPANAGPRVLNRSHSITADVEIPKGAPKARCSRPATSRAAIASTCRAARSTTSTTTSGPTSITSNRRTRSPRAVTRCASNSKSRANPTSGTAKARPGVDNSTSTTNWSGRVTSPSRCPSRSGSSPASSAVPTLARRCGTSTNLPSRLPARFIA